MPERRPNILFLMTDQHRFDLAGFAGNDVVRTPNLDRLAQGAVVFDNAYTPSPICVPGRQCLMSGQLPKTCGCLTFADDLPPNSPTWARHFSQWAYNTVCCGKLHHHGYDQMQGWLLRIGEDNPIGSRHIEGRIESEFKRYERPSRWWNWAKEVRMGGVGRSPHQRIDEYAVLGARNYISDYFCTPFYDHGQNERPVLLKVSLRLPHYPYLTDEQTFTYYLNRVRPYVDQDRFDHPSFAEEWERVEYGRDVDARDVQRATAAYYGMVENADRMFGDVIAALEHAGQDLDDWIVVFTSDHGDMLGQHSIWMKTKFYEGSARVPLFIRWPRRFGNRRVRENVNLCDLYATLCDLAGLPIPDGLDSRSVVPLMQGSADGWFDESVSQLGDNLMIKRGHLKYQYYGPDHDEVLFDLARDPDETVCFLRDPSYAGALAEFRARRAALGSGPDADSTYAGAGYCRTTAERTA